MFSLSISGGINSGLTTTDGHRSDLFLEKEGIIVGRVDSNNDAGGVTATDNAAFAVAIDSTTGVVSVAQYVSLHNNTAEIGVPRCER